MKPPVPDWAPGRLRILVDCRYTRTERHDGISRFTAELVAALGRIHPLVMLISDPAQLPMLPDLPHVLGPSPTSALELLIAPRALNRLRPDIVFSPLQTIGPYFRKYRLVTTIHDLLYYEHPVLPKHVPWPVRLLWRLYHLGYGPERLLLARSDAHVTVSETTRELMVRHRLSRHPIAVIRNGVAHAAAAVHRIPPPTRDVLYVGSFMPYKNVAALVRAIRELPGWRLRLLSRPSDAIRSELAALAPAESVDFIGGATEAEYAEILKNARVLASASLAEGFGLPLVEAMAAGTPIAVSDIPIFHEVAGEQAEFFDPESPADIARAVRMLADDELWLQRSEAGERWSRRYDWDTSAAELLDFLAQTAGGSSPR